MGAYIHCSKPTEVGNTGFQEAKAANVGSVGRNKTPTLSVKDS
jgi:hypothetical protein